MSGRTAQRFDVAVVGGGMAGTTMAAILGTAGLRVASIERQNPAALEAPAHDGRTTALTLGTRRILDAGGLWAPLEPLSCPIQDIRVADGHSPLFLHFDSREVGDQPFGWIAENGVIRRSFRERLAAIETVTQIAPATVAALEATDTLARLTLADGRTIAADLIIGADGRDSFIRSASGIETVGWAYGQHAIVTVMSHSKPHDNIAVENFMAPGPFAILPMTDAPDGTHRSSIVWSDRSEAAPLYMKLDRKAFDAELQRRTGDWLGEVHDIGRRFAYPLQLRHAKRYIAKRVALVADAAHVIHPIAGQGLNLGMRDIGLLAELVIERRRLGLDLGDEALLRRYEAGRRVDNIVFSAATDLLDRLFSNALPPIAAARQFGLGAVNRAPPLRRFFMRRAMGAAGALSRLDRGEPV